VITTTRVPVLMYHEIGEPLDGWERRYFVAPERFRAHMIALRTAGYSPCTLDAFRDWAMGRSDLPLNAVLLTFDDAYRGVFLHAHPFLQSRSIPFSVFAVTSRIGSTDTWLSDIRSPRHSLMSAAELRQLAASGVDLGSHSRRHADLTTLPDDALADEVAGSRAELENVIGKPVHCFSYPYGHVNALVRHHVAAAGYDCAFTTRSGFAAAGDDPLTVRRIDVYGTDSVPALLRKLRFGTNDGSVVSAGRYYALRVRQRLAKQP